MASDSDDDEQSIKNLNGYYFYPSTVPPFTLESNFKQVKTRNSQLLNTDTIFDVEQPDYGYTDPFLHSYADQWAGFVQNIGTNVAYSNQQLPRNALLATSTVSSSGTSMRSGSQDTDGSGRMDIDEEKAKFIKEALPDISEAWGGEERLDALFSQPQLRDKDFKDNIDRRDWLEYLANVKKYYYSNVGTHENEERKSISISRPQTAQYRTDWLEELNREKQKWKQLRKKKMVKWKPRLIHILLDSQYVPLMFRFIIIALCAVSLGLAIRIFQNSRAEITPLNGITGPVKQQASTIMAISVNSFALLYSIYIAYDEYTGRPLGIRNPLGKLKLILFDLFFIIFSSANLALAFNTLYDPRWVCTGDGVEDNHLDRYPKLSYICRKQRALSSFLFIITFVWVMTFSLSIVRVVEKVSSSNPRF
ncbi:hypothetical protein Kpol_2000p8 [Vanderwaltozyma polyspora DSM 70294]|uniref:Regulator of phospholipase D SRF1 n=1 Tax=Vanderwaltozyma polyspora (strain ATCC 22028 / DSM 70294 / BCRC 21397 / CBS 2163 / NBRC 10782 / NRRL Y-8283 / UCD 57-17) TaxID=436907 RepID=A7TF19_VANPO|nr:uncharacterized protein Kpol_2000p8 [Vanderwaltozyma polyspora DSM 70294]EDO19044.1 hypothetical protein Kpol_2000p8 [Vanderwaltozyma polyspora DSM 70294]